jgi:hypothetical protein
MKHNRNDDNAPAHREPDPQRMPDPLARESVPNPFGGRNSVLRVAGSPEAAHRADAANLPLENANNQ